MLSYQAHQVLLVRFSVCPRFKAHDFGLKDRCFRADDVQMPLALRPFVRALVMIIQLAQA
jgi:hypothetical protein